MSEFRLSYGALRATLDARLAESAPTRIQLVTGPRQVGKTTLLLDLAKRLAGTYAALDAPEAGLAGHWDRLFEEAEAAATRHGRALLLLDEVQHAHDWAAKLKGSWDRIRRRKLPIHLVVTGSSALRLSAGSRETLAGRFERMTLSHWPASAVVSELGLSEAAAVAAVLASGAYPGTFPLRHDRARFAAYVRDAIVEPALGRDLLALAPVRKPALLRQVFALASAAPAQIVSLQKLQGQLQDRGALETVAHYLDLLEDAYLIAAVRKYSPDVARRRASPPKLVTLSNALLGVADPRGAPTKDTDPERWGRWVENACLAHAWNQGQSVHYFREEPLEVDLISEGSWGSWAIEVKTGRFTARDLDGLFEVTRRFKTLRPLVVCDEDGMATAERLGVSAVTVGTFLLRGPGK